MQTVFDLVLPNQSRFDQVD